MLDADEGEARAAGEASSTPRPVAERRRWIVGGAVAVGVLVAMARMAQHVRTSSRMQYSDYWPMFDTLLQSDGSWRWRGVLEARNQHPVVIPKLLYIANAIAFDGNNRTLGVVVLLIVLASVGIVALLARATPGIGTAARASLTVTAAWLLFAPFGAWSFVKAMSGTAWLTANLFAVAAILASRSDRRFLAPVLAALATISYGTGLAAWPALVVVIVCRRGLGRGVLREWPTLVAGAVSLGWYFAWYRNRTFRTFGKPSVTEVAERTLTGLGSLPGDGRAASLLGGVLVVLVASSVVVGWRRGVLDAAGPWLALTAFGSLSLLLVGTSRVDTIVSRYSSLSAWAWIGGVGALLAVLPRWRWNALLPLPLLIAAGLGGHDSIAELRETTLRHDRLAVAMRVGVADGQQISGDFAPLPAITDRLARRGHVPFDGADTLDCGLLGTEVSLVGELPDDRQAGMIAAETVHDAWDRTGGLVEDGGDVECVVVVDRDGVVIGAGTTEPAEDGWTVFSTVAPVDPAARVAVRLDGGDELYLISGS